MTENPPSKAMVWGGRVASALPVIALTGSGAAKLSHAAKMVPQFVEKFGYSEGLLTPIGVVEILCTVLYVVPRTRVLGAILLTGYLGGAVATHVRVGDVFVPPLVLGMIVWLGLFLRDARLRELLPLTK